VRNLVGHVEVEIKDNGEGFDLTAARDSTHGLAGMKHRVEAAGGRLTVESTPGEGTRISATLPRNTQPA
jgi:signal transduction histidine kinase